MPGEGGFRYDVSQPSKPDLLRESILSRVQFYAHRLSDIENKLVKAERVYEALRQQSLQDEFGDGVFDQELVIALKNLQGLEKEYDACAERLALVKESLRQHDMEVVANVREVPRISVESQREHRIMFLKKAIQSVEKRLNDAREVIEWIQLGRGPNAQEVIANLKDHVEDLEHRIDGAKDRKAAILDADASELCSQGLIQWMLMHAKRSDTEGIETVSRESGIISRVSLGSIYRASVVEVFGDAFAIMSERLKVTKSADERASIERDMEKIPALKDEFEEVMRRIDAMLRGIHADIRRFTTQLHYAQVELEKVEDGADAEYSTAQLDAHYASVNTLSKTLQRYKAELKQLQSKAEPMPSSVRQNASLA